jgi:hypothetical protein
VPVTVEQINETTFKVTVADGVTTTHTVTLTQDYWRKLTGGQVAPAKLVHKSFEFLLEREPNTSILRTFDLPVIQNYFPDFERHIRKALE